MATVGGVSARLEAIVLAAGLGSRFGGGKLLAPWRGGVLLDGALAAALSAPVRSATIVTGADRRVEQAAREHATRTGQSARVRIAYAADYAEGLSASLRFGVTGLPADTDGAFVFLGDMPTVLLACWRRSPTRWREARRRRRRHSTAIVATRCCSRANSSIVSSPSKATRARAGCCPAWARRACSYRPTTRASCSISTGPRT
jgi:CTP:molybdopterin cytidylyltransferase MocA